VLSVYGDKVEDVLTMLMQGRNFLLSFHQGWNVFYISPLTVWPLRYVVLRVNTQ